ncbi:DNA-binding protein [Weissella koreensis]|uniref:helix-turn-helix domain-containing protein n=1 Tax=Weissella koreensis TaxID=165096 RepID=UPI0022BA229A|nr:helix-turn-helix domain-containing protein [Weissella koreensis]MCZ9311615.1 DNA-binding protein [Weissella koreensis]
MSNKSISQSNVLNLYPAITVNQEQTANLLGLSVTSIQNYVKKGLLHPEIKGARKLFDLDEINSFARPRNKHSKSIYLIADVGDYETFINQVKDDVIKSIQSEQIKKS